MMISENIRQFIDTCWACRHECQTVLFNHCLNMGGPHTEPDHVRLMTDCIQICQAAADAMVRQSSSHADICEVCAKVCDACAHSCEMLDTPEMKRCAEICRQCAASCREMSAMHDANTSVTDSPEDHIMA